ncbi:MAG: hypothetical protein MR291_01125 [Oscillospiraceae bacterium]|nr:hypothetical protein [Oscillospiraceae bacterium]
MLEYCMCPKCEHMIMLDSDLATGFCLYCGTHIAYQESREFLLEGLKSTLPDELKLEADLSELIDEDDALQDSYGTEECRQECAKAGEYLGKWDFANAFKHYSAALEWLPKDFEACCGRMTSGILKLNDVENWQQRLEDCTSLIRSQSDWNTAQKALEYAFDILQRFLSKGGRFVSPVYTFGFFRAVTESFPMLRERVAILLAHCVNIDNAPFTDAARLDHETTRFAVGSYPKEPDRELAVKLLLIMKYHPDSRQKHTLIRAVYVYDRECWLKNHDEQRINDVLDFLDGMFSGDYSLDDRKAALHAGADLLLMNALEPGSTEREKLIFLTRVYSWQQMKRMEHFFSGSAFFNRLLLDIYLEQKGASPLTAEYRRIRKKLDTISDQKG